jgi:hypothetical protein
VAIKLSPYAYSSILDLVNSEQEGDTIFGFDLVMDQESTELIQGYSFKRANRRYQECENFNELLAPWLDGTKLSKAIGKSMNATEISAKLSGSDGDAVVD